MIPADLPERIAARVMPDPSGCWLWTGYVNTKGYPSIRWTDSRQVYVHRLTFHLLADSTLPLWPGRHGGDLDHLCRVKRCVNPAHLEPVTKAENVRRQFADYDTGRHIIDAIVGAGRPLRSGEVAKLAGITAQCACTQLRKLRERGLVQVVGTTRAATGPDARLYAA